jgi:purine-binding chemotaxis protein CheW
MSVGKQSRTIDWADLRARLARAAAETEAALSPTPEQSRQIMDARARILARAPPAPNLTGEQIEILAFSLAEARYGVETRHVREVARLTNITPIPGGADAVIGVTSVRGEILPVIDPRVVFGGKARGLTARLVLCGEQRAEFCMLADHAHEVSTVPLAEIFKAPSSVSGSDRRECVRGLTADGLVIIDAAALLGDERFFSNSDQELHASRQGG